MSDMRTVLPGDVFSTDGGGLLGFLIGYGTMRPRELLRLIWDRLTGGAYPRNSAHNGVVIGVLGTCPVCIDGQLIETHEAFASKGPNGRTGVNYMTRCTTCDAPLRFYRLWRNSIEQELMVKESHRIEGHSTAYDLVMVARIGLYFAEKWAALLKLGWPLKQLRIRIKRLSKPSHYFCTEHVAWCVLAARPELWENLPYDPNELFPEALDDVLSLAMIEDGRYV